MQTWSVHTFFLLLHGVWNPICWDSKSQPLNFQHPQNLFWYSSISVGQQSENLSFDSKPRTKTREEPFWDRWLFWYIPWKECDNFSSKEAPDICLLNYKMTTMQISFFCLTIFVSQLPFCWCCIKQPMLDLVSSWSMPTMSAFSEDFRERATFSLDWIKLAVPINQSLVPFTRYHRY